MMWTGTRGPGKQAMYEFLNLMVQTLDSVCYSCTWDDGLQKVSWKDHDQDCFGLGVCSSVVTVLGRLSGVITFELLYENEPEFAAIALGVQEITGILSRAMQCMRFGLQVDGKHLVTYSSS